MTSFRRPRHRLTVVVLGGALAIGSIVTTRAQQVPAGHCRVSGRATSGGTALPGVAVVVTAGAAVKGVTSTETDGSYHVVLPYGAYRLSAELTGFVSLAREFTIDATTCETPVDLQFALAPPLTANAGPAQQTGARFETLNVQTQPAAAAGLDVNPPDASDAATRLLLPPGFSTEGPTQSVAVTGNMANLDRGMMNDRFEAIGRGEFDPVTGQFGTGFGPPGESEGQAGGRGGPGRGGPGAGGRGGPGGRGEGPGAFMLGGRGRGQNAFSAQANYSFSGSALDSAPYQLRPDEPVSQRPYARHSFGGAVGGPVRIPGVYNGTRRTTFTVNYSGTRGADLFDQYATVPTAAMRTGDFSGSGIQVIDPVARQPFADNQIPQNRISPTSAALLRFIPTPNLPGTSRNFHYTTTTDSANDNVSVRVTHNFTQLPAGRGGPGGRGGGMGGRGVGGRGGRGAQGTNVMINAQVQYRRNDNEQNNVFPALGGTNTGSTLSIPIGLNIQRRRQGHNITVNVTRTESRGTNRYAFVEDVAGAAGITGVATDPFDWGVPQLSFSSLSNVRDMAPTRRRDTRRTFGYAFTQPFRNHTFRAGAEFRLDDSSNQTDANARGAFVFTGLYSSGGSPGARGGGLDFADFLLGLPQQASVQYGPGDVRMRGRSFSVYVQDDWRRGAGLTFNLGVRYELQWPFVERNGQMVNLDAAPDFSAVVPVVSGGTGAFTGRFPDTLLNADRNNLAPRVGFAWRAAPGTIVRGGYGVSYNAGSYSSIARQMVGQPPFAVTNTSIGTAASPLTITDPFAGSSPEETANNYGVQKDYALGVVQTWNADLSREVRQVWNIGAGYTHTRGAALDIVRAPNRGPTGLRIEGVQPFLWQTSEGSSILHAGTFRLARRPVKGVGGGIAYTLARSRDNASSIGGGGTVVAQDDRNLAAEWGLSSFDRRHQLSTNLNVELPFGPNRPWLNGGGTWAALLRDWRVNATFTWQSGTPLTPRVTGAAADVARGTNGTLRANYNGQEIQLANPTIDRFFNTAAFTAPDAGTFGTASRNVIIGPGSRLLNAQLSRDVRLGGNRAVTIQLNANNVLNIVNYRGVDTVVNSPTFGQVLSVAGMRTMQLNLRFRF